MLMSLLCGCIGSRTTTLEKPNGEQALLANAKQPGNGSVDATTSAAPLTKPLVQSPRQVAEAPKPAAEPAKLAAEPEEPKPAEQPAAEDKARDAAQPGNEKVADKTIDTGDDEAPPEDKPAVVGKPYDRDRKAPLSDEDIAEREAVTEIYMRAQKYYYDGDLEAARALLRKVSKSQPHYDVAQRFLKVVEVEIDKSLKQEKVLQDETDYREGKAQKLFRDAERAYNSKRFTEAVELSEKAFKLDPASLKIRKLRADARIAKANADMADNDKLQDARMAEVMANVEKTATPPLELPKAVRPINEDEPNPDAEAEKAMEDKLNEKISVNLEATPLEYLLNIIFRANGVNIIAKPEDLEGKTLTIHVEDIKLLDLLDYVSKTLGVSFTRSRNALWLQGGGETQSGPLMQWRVIPLNKGLIDVESETASSTSNIEKLLEKLAELIDWPQGSQYYLDRKTNALVVRTTSESMEQFTKLVRAIDVTPVQVLIQTKFIQISNKDFNDLGIEWKTTSDWALTKKNGQNNIQLDSGWGVSLPAPITAGPDFKDTSGFDAILAGVMTVPQFQMTLHTLRASNQASDLGGPQIIAVNNATASIEVTQDDYYVKDYQIDRQDFSGSSFSSVYDQGTLSPNVTPNTNQNLDWASPVIKPQYEKLETGFKLKVTPSVGRDLRDITLDLEPDITDLVDTLKTPIASAMVTGTPLQVEQPVVAKRKLKVKLTVSDGYVVAMGGLVKQKKEKGIVKVPILGDIPILGMFFRHETEKNVKYNLLIFVTAKILTSEGRTYVDAGPEGAEYRNTSSADRARELRDRVEVEVE